MKSSKDKIAHVTVIDLNEFELDYLQKLKGSKYDYSCSKCGYLYRKAPENCKCCNSQFFLPTTEIIKKLELLV